MKKIFDNFTGQWIKKIDPETLEITHTENEETAQGFDITEYLYFVFELNNKEARFGRPKDRQPK